MHSERSAALFANNLFAFEMAADLLIRKAIDLEKMMATLRWDLLSERNGESVATHEKEDHLLPLEEVGSRAANADAMTLKLALLALQWTARLKSRVTDADLARCTRVRGKKDLER